MTPKKEWASLGSYPTNARTAEGTQSKAVCKYTYLRLAYFQNSEILFINGVEAIAKWY